MPPLRHQRPSAQLRRPGGATLSQKGASAESHMSPARPTTDLLSKTQPCENLSKLCFCPYAREARLLYFPCPLLSIALVSLTTKRGYGYTSQECALTSTICLYHQQCRCQTRPLAYSRLHRIAQDRTLARLSDPTRSNLICVYTSSLARSATLGYASMKSQKRKN